MRAREFIMKDAYSFHIDQASLEEGYQRMREAYTRIFSRLGLGFRAVDADSGEIGGSRSEEFHVLADSGEDAIAWCEADGYAANVETESAELSGTFRWAGSPAAFSLLALEGEARARADTGRFLEVESGGGAQLILSLLNFTTFAKRISLDFSDVIGRGVSFDRLRGTFTLDHGRLAFIEPLDIDGTGLKLRISGGIDLNDRQLDHEMIVTLPVSRGLPWYAAYVGLANPIAGIGVLVGERVLRKPLEQFSSAKYRITGTMDSPQVSLVSVFDVSTTPRGEEEVVELELEPGFELELGPGTIPEVRQEQKSSDE
jgi:hypothetical protein